MKRPICGMIVLLMALSLTGTGWAATLSWTGSGTGDSWAACANWEITAGIPVSCYPTTLDDAVIPSDDDTWNIDLITVTIDDLSILDDVDFHTATDPTTLTVDSLTIDAADGVAVNVSADGTTIKT